MWFDNIFKDISEVAKNRFCLVTVGANFSQYLLNSVIRFHASKYKNVDKEFSEKVAKSFYVDDFNSTAKDISVGIGIFKKINLRFLDASFSVLKWKNSNPDLQNYFNKMENQFSPTSKIQANDKVKVQGTVWDTISDHLVFSFENLIESSNHIIPTKRNLLILIAKFYDPIGLIQPIIIKLKVLFQEVCVPHADWDIEISEQLKDKFDFIVKFVKTVTAVKVSRCYFYDIMPRDYIVSYKLHGFSDASEKAYGSCLYLKCVTNNNFMSTLLVASKSRVVLYKNKITIPRLELLGNLILSRLILTVLNSFKGEIDISSLYAWSDSFFGVD